MYVLRGAASLLKKFSLWFRKEVMLSTEALSLPVELQAWYLQLLTF